MEKSAINFDRFFGDRLRGGRADGLSDKFFRKKQLAKGIKHEREHTVDPAIAKEIAKDHLAEEPDYYDLLEQLENSGRKKQADALDTSTEEKRLNTDPNTTTNLVSPSVPLEKLRGMLESVQAELRDLQAQTADGESEQADSPEVIGQDLAREIGAPKPPDQDHIRELQDLEQGLSKLILQRQFALRDDFLPGEVNELGKLDVLNRPTDYLKQPADSQSFTAQDQAALPATTGVKSAMIDPYELRTNMFFEGLSTELQKLGRFVDRPLEFFAGVYEGLRHRFEAPEKRATFGTYPEYAVDACRNFLIGQLNVVKTAAGIGQIQPIGPLQGAGGGQVTIPDPNERAVKAVAVDPQRMANRQDLIDELLPHAESIQLDPDGGIKLKMPDPVARAMKAQDAKVKQMQQIAQQQAAQQQQQAVQQQQAAGDRNAAAVGTGQGVQGDTAGTPMNGGDVPEQAGALQQLFGLR